MVGPNSRMVDKVKHLRTSPVITQEPGEPVKKLTDSARGDSGSEGHNGRGKVLQFGNATLFFELSCRFRVHRPPPFSVNPLG